MKTNKQVLIDSIVELISQGKSYKDAKAITGIANATFARYWNKAQDIHAEQLQKLKDALAEVERDAAIEARKKAILNADERKEILTQIAKGEIEIPVKEAKWNSSTKTFQLINYVEVPSHSSRIKAIEELNKMEGDYAPTKVAQTDTKGNNVKTKRQVFIVNGQEIEF